MKSLKLKLIAFVLPLIALSACSLNDNDNFCSIEDRGFVSQVTGADTVVAGEELVLEVTFKITADCGSFIGFYNSSSYPKNIYPRIQYNDDGCDGCATANIVLTEEYTFSQETAGEYQLKFLSGVDSSNEAQYITKTITVTAE